MAEELQNKLEIFIKYIIGIIEEKNKPEFELQCKELIEFIRNLLIFTKEDFEVFDNMSNEYEILQEEVKKYKTQNDINSDKIKSMMDEIEKNFDLQEQNKKLKEDYSILKQKYTICYDDNTNLALKLKDNEKLIENLQEEISNVKKDNFEKFEKITDLEKKNKLNENELSKNSESINKLIIENNDLKKENLEFKNKYFEQQKKHQKKLVILERQIKNLSDSNNNFVQENYEVQRQLKDFQDYTNMVKVNTKDLKDEDFSILEKMSKRAENAELEIQRLLSYINELKALNESLRNKIKPLEDYALLQIKYDHEINTGIDTISDFKNRLFTDEERHEIEKLKKEPNLLLQSLIKLKSENLELHNQLKDIAIECNQQLREAKRK